MGERVWCCKSAQKVSSLQRLVGSTARFSCLRVPRRRDEARPMAIPSRLREIWAPGGRPKPYFKVQSFILEVIEV